MESKSKELISLQILYKALLAGQILFLITAFILVSTGVMPNDQKSMSNVFLIVAIAVAGSAVAFSYFSFNKKLEKAKNQPDLSSKISVYREGFILQLALCEGPVLLSVIFYLLTGYLPFILIIVLMLIHFFKFYPTKPKLVHQLDLSSTEEIELD